MCSSVMQLFTNAYMDFDWNFYYRYYEHTKQQMSMKYYYPPTIGFLLGG